MGLVYNVISADDHVQEHPEVWTSRMSKGKWGDRIPQVQRQPDGTERWVFDGKVMALPGGASDGVAAVGAAMINTVMEPQRWEEVPKTTYDPTARLQAMDMDGIDYSVLYPNVAGLAGEGFGSITDPEFELACVQAYNDFLIEEWASVSDRFVPQCILPIYPIEEAVKEARRAVEKGHRGLVYPAIPMHMREGIPHVNEPEYDPLWSVCEELGVPMCFHAGCSSKIQFPAYEGMLPEVAAALRNVTRPISSSKIVPNLLYSGILERHPNMKVIMAESTLTWGAFTLESCDYHAYRMRTQTLGHPVLPSELFKRQCYFTAWYDQNGIKARRYMGTESIMWGTSFPLTTSTWPNSSTYINRAFQGVEDVEKGKMLWGNAAKLYHLEI